MICNQKLNLFYIPKGSVLSSACPTSFICFPYLFSFFPPSLTFSSPSPLEYQPWMMRCMPTQRQILTTKPNIYVFLIDKCIGCIFIYLLLEINYTAYFKLYEYQQTFSCLSDSLMKSTGLAKQCLLIGYARIKPIKKPGI